MNQKYEPSCKDVEEFTLWMIETIESGILYMRGLFIRAALLNYALTWFGIIPSAGNNMILALSNVFSIMLILYALK